MKKLLLLLLFFGLMLSTIACTTAADLDHDKNHGDLADSLHVAEELAAPLRTEEDDVVIRVYDGVFMKGFSEKKPISELILEPHTRRVTYLVLQNAALEQMTYKAFHEDVLTEEDDRYGEGKVISTIVTKPGLALSSIRGALNVKEVYCLNGEAANNGIYIYFVTDQGDYVYYKEYATTEHEYLFTVEKFYEIAPIIQEQLERDRNNPGGVVTIENIEGIEEFRIHSGKTVPKTIWVLPLLFSAMVLAASLVVYFVRKRKA